MEAKRRYVWVVQGVLLSIAGLVVLLCLFKVNHLENVLHQQQKGIFIFQTDFDWILIVMLLRS